MRLSFIAALAAAVALAACSLPAFDKEADAAARALFEEVRTGADVTKDPHLDPDLKAPQTVMQLAALRKLIPATAPTKVDNRGWKFNTVNGASTAELTHAYHFPNRTLIAETILRKAPGQKSWLIVGFHVQVEGKGPIEEKPVTGEGPEVKT